VARTAGVAVRMVVVRMVVAEARYSYILKGSASRLAAGVACSLAVAVALGCMLEALSMPSSHILLVGSITNKHV
jgi:hypothetical protein